MDEQVVPISRVQNVETAVGWYGRLGFRQTSVHWFGPGMPAFLGCLGIFMNLFRGEVLDRSLHFYFLAPIRRETLVAGKFLAGLLATCVIFVTSELLQIVVFLRHFTLATRNTYLYGNHRS